MNRGFTLLEVVIALLLMEVGVLTVAGTLFVASRSLAEARRIETAVVAAEGVLDSLAGVDGAVGGVRTLPSGEVEWTVDSEGVVELRVTSPDSSLLVDVTSAVVPQ